MMFTSVFVILLANLLLATEARKNPNRCEKEDISSLETRLKSHMDELKDTILAHLDRLRSNLQCCDVGNPECRTTTPGTEYMGTEDTTENRRTCQRWDAQSPHSHVAGDSSDEFPDDSIEAASNYCRNPDGEPKGPWCFTTDPNVRWEYCDIPFCE